MKTYILVLLMAFTISATAAEDFYALKAVNINGDTLHFSELKGKKLMIVNVASFCGYTPQYAQLQELYEKYGGEKFEIIAFPANNFNSQEPGTDEEIDNFCKENFGVTFTMMSKISVKGTDKHPVYQWLTQMNKNDVANQEVLWNFQKYMITEDGKLWKIFSTQTSPLVADITNWLDQGTNSINSTNTDDMISVYPNPANDFITIQFSNKGLKPFVTSDKVVIFDMLGVEIMSVGTGLDLSTQRIDVSKLNPGMYFIRIGDKMQKFVKM